MKSAIVRLGQWDNHIECNCNYTNSIDLLDLKSTLENCVEKYLTMNFGDGQAVVIARGNVYNVIPEVIEN